MLRDSGALCYVTQAMAGTSSSDILTLRREADEALAHAASVDAELARAHAIIADLEARNALIELQNAQMRRALYGHRAERSTRLIDQLELTFADAEETAGEDEALGEVAARHTAVEAHLRERPARRAFPEHLPRERVVVAPPAACPCCGSDDLSKLGEDVTETLEEIGRAHV